MSFWGGVIVGLVGGLAAGAMLARRGGSTRAAGRNRSAVAITIAAVALVASGVALARSGNHDHPAASTETVPGATTTATAAATTASTVPTVFTAPTTTSTPAAGPTVAVPNVVTLTRDAAVTALQKVGLKATVETLNLANVPTGFVVSQTPLPASLAPVGSSVTLEVSSPG